MEKITNKCYNEDHPITEAVYYCIECKISMCNKCESFHSKLFKNHNKITLDKNKDISEIFTGFCKEKNHLDKLDYFCKTHNILCCSGCISKIRLKNKGQHHDCEICTLEDIKENEEKILKENILNIEKLSNEFDKLINEMKNIFEQINKNKEELKLNIQKIFTRIRNAVNEREDEILSKVDQLFDNIYMKENEINEIDKYPNKVKGLLKQGKSEIEKWKSNKNNSLGSFINNCINIEKSLLSINNTEQNLLKCKNGLSSVIKFNPSEENELKEFISELASFGQVYKENKDIQMVPKVIGERFIDIGIKSTKEELNGLSIKFFPFSIDEYNKYYPNDATYGEDDIVLTLHLDAKNEFINNIFKDKENYENELNKLGEEMIENYNYNSSLRKKDNKLFLDLKTENQDKRKDFLLILTLWLNHLQILMIFQNSLTFEKLKEMELNEFYKNFCNLDLSLKGYLKDIENWIINAEKEKENGVDNESKETIDVFIYLAKLLLSNNLKFKWEISKDKIMDSLKILYTKEDFDGFNETYKSIKEEVEGIIIMLANVLETSFSCEMSEDLIYDKILITLLFTQFKSGFVLEINSKGINEYLKSLINKK